MALTEKVTVRFKAVGGAAELPEERMKVRCNRSNKLGRIHDWLAARYSHVCKEGPRQALFASAGTLDNVDVAVQCLYVKSSFMPPLEEEAYGVVTRTGGPRELVIEYCDQPNWGPHFFRAA